MPIRMPAHIVTGEALAGAGKTSPLEAMLRHGELNFGALDAKSFTTFQPGSAEAFAGIMQASPQVPGILFSSAVPSGPLTKTRLSSSGATGLLRLTVDRLQAGDALGIDRRNDLRVLQTALFNLQTSRFDPAIRTKGSPPSEAIVAASIRFGFRYVLGASASDSARIEELTGILVRFIRDNADALGLIGTKLQDSGPTERQSKQRQEPLPSPEAVAERVLTIYDIVSQIRVAIGGESPELQAQLRTLMTPVWDDVHALNVRYTSDSAVIARRVTDEELRRRAIELLDQIDLKLNEVRVTYVSATSRPDPERVKHFMEFVHDDIELWIEALEPKPPFAPGLLRRFMETYIGLWSEEIAGAVPNAIFYSPTAEQNAILMVRRAIDNEAAQNEFGNIARQMLHFILRREGQRARPAGSDGDASVQIPPATRLIRNRRELGAIIGQPIVETFYSYLDRVAPQIPGDFENSTRNASLRVCLHELLLQYVRMGIGIYGVNFNGERLRTNGLEPNVVRRALAGISQPARFSDNVLQLFVDFSQQISDAAPPSIQSMKPPRALVSPPNISADGSFIRYAGDGIRGLMRLLRPYIVGGETFEVAFQKVSGGVRYRGRFELYGSVRREKKMTRHAWNALVNLARERAELPQFLKEHRPENQTAQTWSRAIDIANGTELVRIAMDNQPSGIGDEDWGRYVEYCRDAGQIEDITHGPGGDDALDSLLVFYRFLNQRLAQYGKALDVWDLLAAIFPVAERLLLSERDGIITIMLPEFMAAEASVNWTIASFAENVRQRNLTTNVMPQTAMLYKQGRIQQPGYEALRRYADPLGASSGGGAEQANRIYQFLWMILPHVLHLIRNAARVYDHTGRPIFPISPDMPSRLKLYLDLDTARYGTGVLLPRHEGSVAIDLWRGRHEALLNAVDDFLFHLQNIPASVSLELSDGTRVTLEDISATSRQLREDIVSIRVEQTNLGKIGEADDLPKRLRRLDRGITELADQTLVFMQARGVIETARGLVPFQVIPTINGPTIAGGKWNHSVIRVGDLFVPTSLDAASRNGVFYVRAILPRLMNETGFNEGVLKNPAELREALAGWWQGDWPPLPKAVEDYMALASREPKDLFRYDVRSSSHGYTRVHPPAGVFRPVAGEETRPSLKATFIAFASGEGLSPDEAGSACAVMEAYVKGTRGTEVRLWPEALRAALVEELESEADPRFNGIYQTIIKFLPRMGLSNEVSNESGISNITQHVAERALEAYVEHTDPDPNHTRPISVVDGLLWDFVNQLCAEHLHLHPDSFLALRMAKRMLSDYNAEKSRVHVPAKPVTLLPTEGLHEKWFDEEYQSVDGKLGAGRDTLLSVSKDFAHGVRDGKRPTKKGVTRILDRAISHTPKWQEPERSDPADVDFLTGFLSKQTRAVTEWTRLVDDPELGIEKFLDDHYPAQSYRRLYHERLAALAIDYGVARLTSPKAIDLQSLTADIVSDIFAPYPKLTEGMIQYHQGILHRYLLHLEDGLRRQNEMVELTRLALEEVAQDDERPAMDSGELIERAIETIRSPLSFEGLVALEGEYLLAAEILGVEHTHETLDALVDRLMKEAVEPRKARLQSDVVLQNQQLRTLLESFATFRTQSSVLLAQMTMVKINGLGLADARTAERKAQENLRAVREIEETLENAVADLNRAVGIAERLTGLEDSDYKELPNEVEEAQSSLTLLQKQVGDRMDELQEYLDTLDEYIATLSSEEVEQKRKSELQQLSAGVTEGLSALASVMDEVPPILLQLEGLQLRGIEIETGITTLSVPVQFIAYAELARQGDTLQLTTVEPLQELDDVRTRLAAMLHTVEGSFTTAQKLAEVQEDSLELLEVIRSLQSAMEAGYTREEELGQASTKFRETLENIFGELGRAEDRLAVPSSVKIPTTATIPAVPMVNGPDGTYSIEDMEARRGARDAARLLDPYIDAQELVVGDKVSLIARDNAYAVTQWKIAGRNRELLLRDMFGQTIVLAPYSRGVRVVRPDDGTLFRPLLETLRTHSRMRRIDFEILVEVAKRAQGTTNKASHLLASLFATMMHESAVNPAEGRVVSRWALAHRSELAPIVGEQSARWFKPVLESADSLALPPSYSDAHHLVLAGEVAKMITDSTATLVDVNGRVVVIRRSSYEDVLNTNNVTYFDFGAGRWQTAKMHELGRSGVPVALDLPCVIHYFADTIQRALFRTLHRIYSDTTLKPLGFVLGNPSSASPAIYKMLLPYALTPHDEVPYMELVGIQAAAVGLYQRSKIDETWPELDLVGDDVILKWADDGMKRFRGELRVLQQRTTREPLLSRMIEHVRLTVEAFDHFEQFAQRGRDSNAIPGAVRKRMGEDATFRRQMAQAYLLYESGKKLENANWTFGISALSWLITRTLSISKQSPSLHDIDIKNSAEFQNQYQISRPDILKDLELLARATKEWPDILAQSVLTATDPQFGGNSPETDMVLPSETIKFLERLAKEAAGTSLGQQVDSAIFYRVFLEMPELAGVFIILTLVAPPKVHQEYAGLCARYAGGAVAKAEFKKQLALLYLGHRQEILDALQSPMPKGRGETRARVLTGLAEPWRYHADLGLKDMKPYERIALIAPDLTMTHRDFFEPFLYASKATADPRKVSDQVTIRLADFALSPDRHRYIASALATAFFLLSFDAIAGEVDPAILYFFEDGGEWKAPDAEKKLVNLLLEPERLQRMREKFNLPHRDNLQITYGEVITGRLNPVYGTSLLDSTEMASVDRMDHEQIKHRVLRLDLVPYMIEAREARIKDWATNWGRQTLDAMGFSADPNEVAVNGPLHSLATTMITIRQIDSTGRITSEVLSQIRSSVSDRMLRERRVMLALHIAYKKLLENRVNAIIVIRARRAIMGHMNQVEGGIKPLPAVRPIAELFSAVERIYGAFLSGMSRDAAIHLEQAAKEKIEGMFRAPGAIALGESLSPRQMDIFAKIILMMASMGGTTEEWTGAIKGANGEELLRNTYSAFINRLITQSY